MKYKLAVLANTFVTAVAVIFVSTNSVFVHRPETPQELLKK